MFHKYSLLIARRPLLVVLFWISVGVLAAVVAYFFCPLPEFNDPLEGFITRGTVASERLASWKNLLRHTSSYTQPLDLVVRKSASNKKRRSKRLATEFNNESTFTCSEPSTDLVHVVLKIEFGNIGDLTSIQSICEFQERVKELSGYSSHCLKATSGTCCPILSFPNAIANFVSKKDCKYLTSGDIQRFDNALKQCLKYADNLTVLAPKSCVAISFPVIDFFLEKEFASYYPFFGYTIIYLPMVAGQSSYSFYPSLEDLTHAQISNARLVGLYMGIKYFLLEKHLVTDMLLALGAMCGVFLTLLLFTGSLWIVSGILILTVISLVTAYCIYFFVLRLTFFPYLNFLAIILLLAIGTDDALVYFTMWGKVTQTFRNREASDNLPQSDVMHRSVQKTIRMSFVSLLSTSATTIGAILSNCVCPIISLRCFSIFASVSLAVQFFLTVTCFPAIVVLSDVGLNCSRCCSWKFQHNYLLELSKKLQNQITRFFAILLNFMKNPALLIFIFLLHVSLIFVSVYFIAVYPRLRSSSLETFQVFDSDNPLERYDLDLKYRFRFDEERPTLPAIFVWGVEPTSFLSLWNPKHVFTTQIAYTNNFNLSGSLEQRWLLEFCDSLSSNKFYRYNFPLTSCIVRSLYKYMNQPCITMDEHFSNEPCCDMSSSFPYYHKIFNLCLNRYTKSIMTDPLYIYEKKDVGVRYAIDSDKPIALSIEFVSNISYEASFADIEHFIDYTENWFKNRLKSAPPSLRKGFFTGPFIWFDIRLQLSKSLGPSIAVASCIVLTITLLSLRKLTLTLIIFFQICSVALMTISILVLIGWTLGVLECIFIIICSGLSVDLPLHFIVLLTHCEDSSISVENLDRILTTLLFAASTTLLTGLCLTTAVILAYKQLGVFLVVITLVSMLHVIVFLSAAVHFWSEHRLKSCSRNRRRYPLNEQIPLAVL